MQDRGLTKVELKNFTIADITTFEITYDNGEKYQIMREDDVSNKTRP